MGDKGLQKLLFANTLPRKTSFYLVEWIQSTNADQLYTIIVKWFDLTLKAKLKQLLTKSLSYLVHFPQRHYASE